MGRLFRLALVLTVCAMMTACGEPQGPARVSLQWTIDDSTQALVSPSQSLKSSVVVRNEGRSAATSLTLRFDQNGAGQLPYGFSVGTVTNVSSRFEGESQVWELGTLGAGDAMVFPITLWFDALTRTAEPANLRLVIVATSPSLPDPVTSNLFEVQVDTRQASGR